jgi:hypothetical protein
VFLINTASSNVLPLTHSSHQRTRGYRRTSAERFELGVLDNAIPADLNLQLHHIAAGRRANKAGAHIRVVLIERADLECS